MFENSDYLGVQSFRDDVSYVFKANTTRVKLIQFNPNKSIQLQGDFLGLQSKQYSDTPKYIDINIMSQNPKGRNLDRDGNDGRGNIQYECYASYDTEIKDEDIVEFIEDVGFGVTPSLTIQSGERYRVSFKDFGLYQGQYTYKKFTLNKIN